MADGDANEWQAGVARVDITPEPGIWLDGWGARTHASKGVSAPIYVKALALKDAEGQVAVMVTSDLLGFSPSMTESLVAWAARTHDLLLATRVTVAHMHSDDEAARVEDTAQAARTQRFGYRTLERLSTRARLKRRPFSSSNNGEKTWGLKSRGTYDVRP